MTAIPYKQAMDDIKARVSKSRTSFHAGMNILPKPRRNAMYAFYAFCREVDDIADDSPTLEESSQGLALWRQRIADLFKGKATDPITSALMPAIKDFNLVEEDFQHIIDGMAMDSHVICAPPAAMLDIYCDRVASAVGRVSVRIFGDSSADAMVVSHHLGRAFQLTNILRDLHEDAARGRLYLPTELLTLHGITLQTPQNTLQSPSLRAICRELAKQADDHYAEAENAMQKCNPSAMRPAKIMRAYYKTIFDRLVEEDWQDITQRVRLPKWQKIWLVLRTLIG